MSCQLRAQRAAVVAFKRSECSVPASAEPAGDDERDFDDGDDFDDMVCDRCNNDGLDPWTDYLLPCPACQGEQTP